MAHRERTPEHVETPGARPEARPEPSPFKPTAQAPGSTVSLHFTRADGVVGSLVNFTEDLSARGALTSESIGKWAELKDRELGRFEGTGLGDLAQDARQTFHQAQDEMRQAEEARRAGNTAEADKHDVNARFLFNMGVQRTHELRRMDRAGYENEPPQIQDAMRGVYDTAGRGGEAYSDRLYDGVYQYNDKKAILESGSPGMDQARAGLLDHIGNIGRLAESGTPLTPALGTQLDQNLSLVIRPVDDAIARLATAVTVMQRVLSSGGRPNEYMNELNKLKQDLETYLKKAQEEKKEGEDQEKAKMVDRNELAKDAEADIEGSPAQAKAGVAAIYARALKALRTTRPEEARVHQQLAREYSKASPERKEELERWSKWLEDGRLTAADLKGMLSRGRTLDGLDSIMIGGKKAYTAEVAEIRKLDREASDLMKKADRLRQEAEKTKDPQKKKELMREAEKLETDARYKLRQAEAKTKGLLELAKTEDDLRKAGAPEPVIKAVRAAYRFYGTASQWRAETAMRVARLLVDNKQLMGSKIAAPLVGAVVKFLGILGGPKSDSQIGGREKAERYVERELEPKAVMASLGEAGAPAALMSAVKSAAGFFGTREQWRGELIMKAAKLFLQNRRSLTGKGGARALAGLLGLVSRLSDPEEKNLDQKDCERDFESILKFIAAVPKEPVKAPETRPETAPAQAPAPQPQVAAPAPQVAQAPDFKQEYTKSVSDLEGAGAPRRLLSAAKAAERFIGTSDQWRAEIVLRTAKMFLGGKDILTSAAAKPVLDALVGSVEKLSGPKKLGDSDRAKAEAYVSVELEPAVLRAGLLAAKAPRALIDAVRGIPDFIAAGMQWRADLIKQAAAYYLENPEGMKGDRLQAYLGFVSRLATAGPGLSQKDAEAEFGRLTAAAPQAEAAEARGMSAADRDKAILIIEARKASLQYLLAYAPDEMKGGIQGDIAAADGMLARLRKPEEEVQGAEITALLGDWRKTERESMLPALKAAGAPQPFMDAYASAQAFIGTDQEWRATAIMSLARLYLKNRDLLTGPMGQQMLTDISSDSAVLADPTKRLDREKVAGILAGYEKDAADLAQGRRESVLGGLKDKNIEMLKLAREAPVELRPVIEAVARDNIAITARLGSGEDVSDAELLSLGTRMVNLSEIVPQLAELKDKNPKAYGYAVQAYAAAYRAYAATGDSNMFDIMVMAADQIVQHPERANEKLWKGVVQSSNALADAAEAKDAEAVKKAGQGLIAVLSSSMSGELAAASKIKGAEEATGALSPLLGRIAGYSQHPEAFDITDASQVGYFIGDMQRGLAALDILQKMRPSIARKRMDPDVRAGGIAIYKRAFETLADDRMKREDALPLATSQAYLAEEFLSPRASDDQRKDIEALSSALAQDPTKLAAVQRYVAIAQSWEEQQKRIDGLPPPARRAAMDASYEYLRRMSLIARTGSIATAQEIADEEARIRKQMEGDEGLRKKVEAYAASNNTTVDAVVKSLATAQAEDTAQKRLGELDATVKSMPEAYAKAKGEAQRFELAEIYGYSVSATLDGRLGEGAMLRDAAAAYSSLENSADRTGVLEACRRFSGKVEGAEPLDKQAFSDTINVYRMKAEYLPKISERKAKANAGAYFDLALISIGRGDREESQSVADWARTYAGWAALSPKDLGPDDLAQRKKAMGEIEGVFGDFSGLGRKRLIDIGKPAQAGGWSAQGMDLKPAAAALIGGGSIAGALGQGDEEAGGARLRSLEYTFSLYSAGLEDVKVRGQFAAIEKADQKAYGGAVGWLQGQAADARKQGLDTLADYYEATGRFVKPEFTAGALAEAKKYYEQGVAERNEALRLDSLSREAAAGGDTAKAEELRAQAKTHADNAELLMGRAKAVLGGLDSLRTGVGLDTLNRDHGWLDLGIGVNSELGIGKGFEVDEFGDVLMKGGEPVKLQPARAEKLESKAEALIGRGAQLVLQQARIQKARDEGIWRARKSIHDVNISNAKQLIGGMIALLPEADEAQRKEKEDYEKRFEEAVKNNDVKALQRIYLSLGEKLGVRTSQDIHVEDAHDKIDPLIERLPKGMQDEYRQRLDEAIKYKNVVGLSVLYKDLGKIMADGYVSVYVEGGTGYSVPVSSPVSSESIFLYDAVEHEQDYRRVVYQYRRERFDSAERESGAAQFSLNASFTDANLFITYKRFRNELGGEFGKVGGDDMTRRYEVNKMVISYLPPDQRQEKMAELEAIYRKGEAGKAEMELFTKDITDNTQYRGRNVYLELASGSPVFFDALDLHKRIAEAKTMAGTGNIRGAGDELESIRADASNSEMLQQYDNQVITRRKMLWANLRGADDVGAEFSIAGQQGEDSRDKADRESINEAMAPLAEMIKASYLRMAYGWDAPDPVTGEIKRTGGWEQAADAALAQRDYLAFNGGKPLGITPDLVGGMLGLLDPKDLNRELPNGRTYNDMLEEMRTAPADKRGQLAQEMFQLITANQQDIHTVMEGMRASRGQTISGSSGESFEVTDGAIIHLESYETNTVAMDRERQSSAARAYAKMLGHKTQELLQYSDQADLVRDETSVAMNMKSSQRFAWLAGDAAAVLSVSMDPQNDYRFMDMVANNTSITIPEYHFIGSIKKPRHDENVTVLLGGGTSGSFGSELSFINRSTFIEMAPYTVATDIVTVGGQWTAREMYDDEAKDMTVLELGTLGIRTIYSGNDISFERWDANDQEFAKMGEAYQNFSALHRERFNAIFGIKAWLSQFDEEIYLDRIHQRLDSFDSAANALFGPETKGKVIMTFQGWRPGMTNDRPDEVVYDPNGEATAIFYGKSSRADTAGDYIREGVPFKVNSDGTMEDPDRQTKRSLKWMKKMQSIQNTAMFVIKTVRIAAEFAASPVTGGASGAAAIAELTYDGYEGAKDYWRQTGGWKYMTAGEKGLFGVMVVTTALTPILPGVGKWAEVRVAGEQALMIGAEETMAAGTRGLSLATRSLVYGAKYGGYAMIGLGTAQGVWNIPQMMDAYKRGDMEWYEMAAEVTAIALPVIQTGLHARRMVIQEQTGIPAYRPRWLQTIEALTLGTPWDSAEVHATARAYADVRTELVKMPAPDREAYVAYKRKYGIEMTPDAEAEVLKSYRQARESGRFSSFDAFAGYSLEIRAAKYDGAAKRFFNRETSVSALTDDEYVYVEAVSKGKKGAEALAEITAYEDALRDPAVRANEAAFNAYRTGRLSLEGMGPGQKAYSEARGSGKPVAEAMDAYKQAASEDEAAMPGRALAKLDAEEAAANRAGIAATASELGGPSVFSSISVGGDGRRTYSMGRGDSAVSYSQEHLNTAAGLVYFAEGYLAAEPGSRAAFLRSVPEPLRDAVTGLASDPSFVSATEQKNRRQQAVLGLERAGYLRDADRETVAAAYSTEALELIQSRALSSEDLEGFAGKRRAQAAEIRSRAEAFEKEAAGAEEARGELLRDRAKRMRIRADALDESASMLEREAGHRAPPVTGAVEAREGGAGETTAGPKVVVEFDIGNFVRPEEIAALHPQVAPREGGGQPAVYHNEEHTGNVARSEHALAMSREFTETDARIFGSREEKATFEGQVAFLHDVDPTRQPGKPARVAATLEWMDSPQGQEIMRERFGWDDRKIAIAKAMIQRTEFPFDNAKVGEKTELGFPRGKIATYGKDSEMDPSHPDQAAAGRISGYYQDKSPLERYSDMLAKMDPDARAFVINEAPIMAEYADKASYYFEDPTTVFNAVEGLGTEGLPNPHQGTYKFLLGVGTPDRFVYDRQVAERFGTGFTEMHIDKVMELLGPKASENWKTTLDMYRSISEGASPEAALLEHTVGLAPGSDALESMTGAVAPDARAAARVLEKLIPSGGTISEQELAKMPKEYRPAIEAYNEASQEQRDLWARDPAAKAEFALEHGKQIAFERAEARFAKELAGKQLADEGLVAAAKELGKVVHGGEVPSGRMDEFLEMIGAVHERMQGGMSETDAIIDVAAASRRPEAVAARESARLEELYRDGDAATLKLVNERLGTMPPTRENVDLAIARIVDERARPDAARLGEAGGAYFALPGDIVLHDGSRVSVAGELNNIPRARIVGVIDDSTGSTGGVYVAEIVVNGQTRTVAVKAMRGPPERQVNPETVGYMDAVGREAAEARAAGHPMGRDEVLRRIEDSRVEIEYAREVSDAGKWGFAARSKDEIRIGVHNSMARDPRTQDMVSGVLRLSEDPAFIQGIRDGTSAARAKEIALEHIKYDRVADAAQQIVLRRQAGEQLTEADMRRIAHDSGVEDGLAGAVMNLAEDPEFIKATPPSRGLVSQAQRELAARAFREGEWGWNYEFAQAESRHILDLNSLGVGTEGLGIVAIGDRYGVAMEFVKAKDIADMDPGEIKRSYRPETSVQLRDQLTRIVDQGYMIHDFQYGIVTEPTPGRNVGDVVIWDAGGTYRIMPEDPVGLYNRYSVAMERESQRAAAEGRAPDPMAWQFDITAKEDRDFISEVTDIMRGEGLPSTPDGLAQGIEILRQERMQVARAWVEKEVANSRFLASDGMLVEGYLEPAVKADPSAFGTDAQVLGQVLDPLRASRVPGGGPLAAPEDLPGLLRDVLKRETKGPGGELIPPAAEVRARIEEVRASDPQLAARAEEILVRYEREAGLPRGSLIEPQRASVQDVQSVSVNAPAAAAEFTIRAVVESGRTLIAGSEYGQGVRASNNLWFRQAGEVVRGIAERESAGAAAKVGEYVRLGTPEGQIPDGEGDYFQTNALMGNGNSDERGIIIATRRGRDFRSAVHAVREWVSAETSAGRPPDEAAIRERARMEVDAQAPVMDTFVIAIDKSGLGDIDRTTSYYIDDQGRRVDIVMGRDPASVISRELFGDMMGRAGEILQERAKANGGRLTQDDIDAAMAQVKNEVMGSRRIEDGMVGAVADTRDILRTKNIDERAAAQREGRGFRPISAEDESAAATAVATRQVLREKLGHEPTDEEVRAAVSAPSPDDAARIGALRDRILSGLHVPDPRTYRVQVGPDAARAGTPQTITLGEYAERYLGRGTELIAAFAHGTIEHPVRPGEAGGMDFGAMYERAEQRSASYTHPDAEALGIPVSGPQAVSGVDEHGISRLSRGDALEQGSSVAEVRFKLTDAGRADVEKALHDHVTAAATMSGAPTPVDGIMKEFSVARPEAERLYSAIQDGTFNAELFFEVVPRKGILFARGEWGFSEGNTGLGHYGMNALAQAVADAAAGFPGARFVEDNLTVQFPPGTPQATVDAFYARVRDNLAARGIHGLDVAGTTSIIDRPMKVSEFRAQSDARSLGIDVRGVEPLRYLVHSIAPSRQDLVYFAVFGAGGEPLRLRMNSLSEGVGVEQARARRIEEAGRLRGTERDGFLLASAIEEIRSTRSLRRPRDALAIFNDRAESAKARREAAAKAGDQVGAARAEREEAYWRGAGDALRRFSVEHGTEFITRYHSAKPAGGGGPGGRGAGGGPRQGGGAAETTAVDVSKIPSSSLDANDQAQRSELARRMLSADGGVSADARARFESLPEAGRISVGYELAYGLGLDTQAGIEEFGKNLAAGKQSALETLALLPEDVRGQMERLFGTGAQADRFRLPRTRKPAVQMVWNDMQQLLHEKAPRAAAEEQRVEMAAGGGAQEPARGSEVHAGPAQEEAGGGGSGIPPGGGEPPAGGGGGPGMGGGGPGERGYPPEAVELANRLAESPIKLSSLAKGLIEGDPKAVAELEKLDGHPAREHVESLARNPDIIGQVRAGQLPDLDIVRTYSKAIIGTLTEKPAQAPPAQVSDVADSEVQDYLARSYAGDQQAGAALAARYAKMEKPVSAFDELVMREIAAEESRSGVPREQAARSVVGSLFSRFTEPETNIIAAQRARDSGRASPSAEDFAAAYLIAKEADRFAGGPLAGYREAFVLGLAHISAKAKPGELAGLVEGYERTVQNIAPKLPVPAYGDSVTDTAIEKVFGLAAMMHLEGFRDPAAMLSNGRNGLLDLFPATGPEAYSTLSGVADVAIETLGKIPPSADFKIQGGGKTETVTRGRGEIAETVFGWMFEDMRRLKDPGPREVYLRKFDSAFTWDGFSSRYGELETRAAKSKKSVGGIEKLPILAYVADGGSELGGQLILKTFDNDFFRSRLGSDASFQEFVGFMENVQNAARDNNRQSKAWLAAARESLEFLNMGKPERDKLGISESQKDSRKFFLEGKMGQLNTLWEMYRNDRAIDARALVFILEGITGEGKSPAKADFEKALAKGYLEVFGNNMGLPDSYVLEHTGLYLEAMAYRKNIDRIAKSPPDLNMSLTYVGRMESFGEALAVLDSALKAEGEGRFAQFKFSDEFHAELKRDFGDEQGTRVFEGWKADAKADVSQGGRAYHVEEASSFDDLFHSGVYRGEIACQNPKNDKFQVAGLVGMIELPWMKEVVVNGPDGTRGDYKRWLILANDSETGRPVLLVQPGYGSIGNRAEADAALMSVLRQKYEPMGIEVRDMSDSGVLEDERLHNYGYKTFGSGNSPLFYIDSNMYSFTDRGGTVRAQHGLHDRRHGQEVDFGRGWQRTHRVEGRI